MADATGEVPVSTVTTGATLQTSTSEVHPALPRQPLVLEDRLYDLSDEEFEFYKKETGIDDPDVLKKHVLQVQAEAYAVWPYPCIRRFSFTKLKISRYPAYQQLLKLGRERAGALFLDAGCCFGNDVRKAVIDGFPVDQAIASDLRPEFWDLGHKLFKSTPESFPVTFLPGSIFDSEFLKVAPPATAVPTTSLPPLKDLRNLTPLNGRLSAIHASAFFHLFDEPHQLELAKIVAGLLSPEPGAIIFGSHRGQPVKGLDVNRDGRKDRFSHSPESWNEMWEKEVFQEGQVKTWAILKEIDRTKSDYLPEGKYYLLVWSVTRI